MIGAFYKPVKGPEQSWQKSSMATGLILPEYKKGRKRQREWWKEKSENIRK